MCYLSLLFVLMVALQMSSCLVEASLDDDLDLFDSANLIEMPEACKGKSYCFEQGDNYPSDKVEKIVAYLHELELDTPEARINFGSRSGDGATIECKKNSTENPIYYITDTDNNVRVVVQSEKNFKQLYSLEWCLEDGPVSDTEHFLKGMKCVTKFMDLDFFVLSDTEFVTANPKMTIARAKIPVCCRCQYDAQEVIRQYERKRQELMQN